MYRNTPVMRAAAVSYKVVGALGRTRRRQDQERLKPKLTRFDSRLRPTLLRVRRTGPSRALRA
eukprot:5763801-Prymnesium_polylepis.1